MEGAAAAIGRLGYASVRVEDIIEAARVSRPTFYKVYTNKEDILNALSSRHHREIRRRIEDAAASSSGELIAQIAALVDTFLRWRAGLGPAGRELDLTARAPASNIAHHRRATLRSMTRLMAKLMADAGRPEMDPVMVTAMISALESIADSLLLGPTMDDAALQRAHRIGLRIVGASIGDRDDPIPPIPSPPAPGRTSKRG